MQTFKFKDFLSRSNNVEENPLLNILKDLNIILGEGVWLAGGAIRRTLIGQSLDSDFDFFFKSKAAVDKFLKEINSNKNIRIESKKENEHNIQLVVKLGEKSPSEAYEEFRELVKKNPKAMLTPIDEAVPTDVEVKYTLQLITINYYKDIEEVLNSFDFTICQFGYDGENLYCGDTALWDLARKRLVVHNIEFPVASMRRMFKYVNQGFYACNGCLTTFLNIVAETPELVETRFKYID